jgi:hypothetical protein
MDAPDRGALMLVRFIALSLVGIAVVNLTLNWVVTQHNHTGMPIFSCVLNSILAVIGLLGLIKSKTIAGWISSKLDE